MYIIPVTYCHIRAKYQIIQIFYSVTFTPKQRHPPNKKREKKTM